MIGFALLLSRIPGPGFDIAQRAAPISLAVSRPFYGISAIWERDVGVLQRYLVSPALRSALVFGKALSKGVRTLSQTIIVYVLALALGGGIDVNPFSIADAAVFIVLGSALFSTLSLIVVCIGKTRERFMGIGQPSRDNG